VTFHVSFFRNHILLPSERQGACKILGRTTTNLLIRAQAPKPQSGQVRLSTGLRFFLMYRGTHRLRLPPVESLNPLALRYTWNCPNPIPGLIHPYMVKISCAMLLLRFTSVPCLKCKCVTILLECCMLYSVSAVNEMSAQILSRCFYFFAKQSINIQWWN